MAGFHGVTLDGGGILINRNLPCSQPPTSNFCAAKPLYKYMHKEHALDLVKNGFIKIGTLYDFRLQESHGEWIGDRLEGFCNRFTNQTHFFNSNIMGMQLNNVNIINTHSKPTVSVQFSSPDYYLYCTTYLPDKSVLATSGYDTCVRINDPRSFFKAVTNKLNKKTELIAPSYDCHPVIYEKKEHLIDLGVPVHTQNIWRTKCLTARYSQQKEVRCRWAPRKRGEDNSIALPPVFRVKQLSDFCEIIGL